MVATARKTTTPASRAAQPASTQQLSDERQAVQVAVLQQASGWALIALAAMWLTVAAWVILTSPGIPVAEGLQDWAAMANLMLIAIKLLLVAAAGLLALIPAVAGGALLFLGRRRRSKDLS